MARSFYTATAALLLCVVVAQASRLALEEDFDNEDFIGRGLLQRTLNCKSVHPACSNCRNQRIAGTRRTELVCSSCETGWRLRRDGKSKTCDCAPGLHKVTGSDNELDTCEPCPEGKYCVGGSATNTGSTATNCPSGLATTFPGAKSLQQCFTQAGYGRSSQRNANGFVTLEGTICDIGTYNVGRNTAGCQKCPAGLTTENAGSTALTNCKAPAGSYVDKGIGKLCPKGTYTTALNSATSCTACPDGITTAGEGSDSAADCQFAKRGFYLTAADTAAPCPVNTYNDGETLEVGDTCTACPNEWKTKDVGADGQSLCLAPPGYELKDGASAITECEIGYYKADWNRNGCVECGPGLTTAAAGSVSKDACLVPAGFGVTSLNPLAAALCTMNTYGSDAPRPASAAARCVNCAPNMFTLDHLDNVAATAGYTGETDCLVRPGWGVTAGGMAEKCRHGFYNAGKNRLPCQSCPAGYTTLNEESESEEDCVIQAGWYFDSENEVAAPCDVGTWSAGGNAINSEPTSCTACGIGITTQTDESTSAEDCKICKAGYGGTNCAQCGYNTFSFGGQMENTPCTQCAAGSVSRRRSTEAAMCYSEMQDPTNDVFVTDGTWSAPSTLGSSAACAAACTADASCMTYRYKADSSTDNCELFMEEDAAGTQELYFKLNNGADFVQYKVADSVTFGAPVDSSAADSATTAAQCMAACSESRDCEVASFADTVCKLVKSEMHEDYTGMWAVRGNRLVSDQSL